MVVMMIWREKEKEEGEEEEEEEEAEEGEEGGGSLWYDMFVFVFVWGGETLVERWLIILQ